jgi:hypothetical protein
MMAPDSTSNQPELNAESLATLEAGLLSLLAGEIEPPAIEPALRRIAAEARDKGMTAEQLLIVLKDVWLSLPSIDRAIGSEAQNAVLQRVVSLCIRSYYST